MATRVEGGVKDGVERLPVERMLSHRTENFRSGIRLCSRNLRVSERFMKTRGEGEGRRGERWSITSSRRKIVVLHYQKTS